MRTYNSTSGHDVAWRFFEKNIYLKKYFFLDSPEFFGYSLYHGEVLVWVLVAMYVAWEYSICACGHCRRQYYDFVQNKYSQLTVL